MRHSRALCSAVVWQREHKKRRSNVPHRAEGWAGTFAARCNRRTRRGRPRARCSACTTSPARIGRGRLARPRAPRARRRPPRGGAVGASSGAGWWVRRRGRPAAAAEAMAAPPPQPVAVVNGCGGGGTTARTRVDCGRERNRGASAAGRDRADHSKPRGRSGPPPHRHRCHQSRGTE